MMYTLWYAKEILAKEFIVMYGVSLIKYYYEDACSYYSHQEEIKRSMENNSNVEIKTKVIKINKTTSTKPIQSNSLIDLGNLIKGGDTH